MSVAPDSSTLAVSAAKQGDLPSELSSDVEQTFHDEPHLNAKGREDELNHDRFADTNNVSRIVADEPPTIPVEPRKIVAELPEKRAQRTDQPQKKIVADNPDTTYATNSNATNATTANVDTPRVANATIEFAKPSGWGELWRIERNGKYFFYRLRFTDSRDVPQEFKRVTRPGGKLTPQIQAALKRRKGRGRHKESRDAAERLRRRAITVAGEFRPSVNVGTPSQGVSGSKHSDIGIARDYGMSNMPDVDGSADLYRVPTVSERIN